MNNFKSELRIGSLIYWDGEIATVMGIITRAMDDHVVIITDLGETYIERIKPIKLTDEIYKKLGGNFRIDEGWITTDDNGGTYCCNDNYEMVFAPPCEYVHQLQNLYFILTGNELKRNGF